MLSFPSIIQFSVTVFLCVSFALSSDPVWTPCPFNQLECNCTLAYPLRFFTFQDVTCESVNSAIPVFVAPPKIRYTVLGALTIGSAHLQHIPANHFAVFYSIHTLSLEQHGTAEPVAQQWDQSAFDGVEIDHLAISGLDGVLPLPPVLQYLGSHGLKSLSISSARSNVQLGDHSFEVFNQLEDLSISQMPISGIDAQAFSGLENLKRLSLNSVSLKIIPFEAIFTLSATLEQLELENNGISDIPEKALSKFSQLKVLSLSGNDLKSSIEAGVLDTLPPKLETLLLENVGLISIPQKLIRERLSILSLADNGIETIKSDDFKSGINLKQVSLNGNPVSAIENGAFSPLIGASLFDLRDLAISSIDLSVFERERVSYTDDHMEILLDGNALLKDISAGKTNKMPAGVTISLRNTALERIDSSLEKLLGISRIQLDLGSDVHLKCKQLSWLAEYVSCSRQIKVEGAKCADKDGQVFSEYLKNITPKRCSISFRQSYAATTTTTTTSTTRTTTTTTSTSSTTTKPARKTSSTTPPNGASCINGNVGIAVTFMGAVMFWISKTIF